MENTRIKARIGIVATFLSLIMIISQHYQLVFADNPSFGPTINLSEGLPPLFVADDIDYDNISIASSPDGQNVYVVWASWNNTIFFRVSHDSGVTFDPAVILSNASNSGGYPRLINSGQNVYVVWWNFNEDTSDLLFRASHDNGTTFDPVVNLGTIGGTVPGFLVEGQMAASDSNVYIAWTSTNSIGDGNVLFRASHDNGITFDPLTSLANITDSFFLFPQVVAPDDHVYVGWHKNLKISDNNGVTFDRSTNTSVDIVGGLAAQGSNVYALSGFNPLFISASHDNGTTFDPSINLGTYHPDGSEVDTAHVATSDSNVYVLWPAIESLLFATSHDSGVTFEDAVNLHNGDQAKMAVFEENVYIVLRYFDGNSNVSLLMSGDGGETFGPLIGVGEGGYLNVPKISVSNDNIFVIWQDQTSRNDPPFGDVFFRAASSSLNYHLDLFEGVNPSDTVINLGYEARAVASTNNVSVNEITFRWIDPGANIDSTATVPVIAGEAEDSFTPDEAGRWIVVADFGNGLVRQQTLDVEFFVIPESPIGLIALVASSLAALGAYMKFRPKV
ncbi:MAG: hypothetical protein HMLIMOIP_001273 [Candidatus Nitrosomirales archaeon]